MPFCQHCGSQASATADFCFNCGADVAAAAMVLPDLPERWKVRFALLHKAGGVSLPQSIALTLPEHALLRFNGLAFLFGPLYYCALGMWRKALTLGFLALMLVFFVRALLGALGLGGSGFDAMAFLFAPLLYAMRANVDYFTRKVLQDDGWL